MSGPWVKFQKVEKQWEGPWTKFSQENEEEEMGAAQTYVETAADDFALGHLPQIKAGAMEAGEAVGMADEAPYAERRDKYRNDLKEGQANHPVASGLGTATALGGLVLSNPGGAAVKAGAKMLPSLAKTPMGRAAIESLANLGMMVLQNPGDDKGEIGGLDSEGQPDALQLDRRGEMLRAPIPFTENIPVLKDIPVASLAAIPMVGPTIGRMMGKGAEKAAAKAFSPTPQEIERSVANPSGLVTEENLGRYALDTGIEKPMSRAQQLYDGASNRAKVSGERIGKFIKQNSEKISRWKNQDTKGIQELNDVTVTGFHLDKSKGRVLADLSKTDPDYKSIKGIVDSYFDTVKDAWTRVDEVVDDAPYLNSGKPSGKMSKIQVEAKTSELEELQKMRGEIQDKIRYERKALAKQPGSEKAYEAILNEIDRGIEAELDSISSAVGDKAKELQVMRNDYTLARKLEDRSLRQLGKEGAQKAEFNLPTAAAVGAGTALMQPDITKAVAGFLVGGLAPNLKMGPRGYSTAANIMNSTAPRMTTSPSLAATMSAPEPEIEGFPVRTLRRLSIEFKEAHRARIKSMPSSPSQKARQLNLLEKGWIVLP